MTKETKDLGAAPPRSLTDSELNDLQRLLLPMTPASWSADGELVYDSAFQIGAMDAPEDAAAISALRNAATSLISDSRALLEARRLLGMASDTIVFGTYHEGLVSEIDAFLRSDSERSEPERSESEGSNSVAAPTKEER